METNIKTLLSKAKAFQELRKAVHITSSLLSQATIVDDKIMYQRLIVPNTSMQELLIQVHKEVKAELTEILGHEPVVKWDKPMEFVEYVRANLSEAVK